MLIIAEDVLGRPVVENLQGAPAPVNDRLRGTVRRYREITGIRGGLSAKP